MRSRPLAALRRAVAWIGAVLLCVALAVAVEWWCGLAYLAGLYGSLGSGLLPALSAAWVLVGSLTLLPALWAAWPLLSGRDLRRRVGLAAALGLGVSVILAAISHSLARPRGAVASELSDAELRTALGALGKLAKRLPAAPGRAAPLVSREPARCSVAPDAAPVTLVAAFLERERGAPTLACFQGAELAAVLDDLARDLSARALRGPLELELVSGVQRLSERHAWLDGFKLRPGLDGICHEGACLMPWQLLAEGAFSTYRPLGFIPDLQFGVAPSELRQLLGAPAGDGVSGLARLTTRSFVIDLAVPKPRVVPLSRMRRREVSLSERNLDRAEQDAEAYVLSAQLPDGRFRYTLDPITGEADTLGFNLARQAGTTLVLCELGHPKRTRRAVARALGAFTPFVQTHGQLAMLMNDPASPVARIGESALPLVSMLACAELDKAPLAPAAAGLARLLLALQRPDGGFAPSLSRESGEALAGPEPLYASGQAVLALVLLEQRQARQPDAALPPLPEVRAAVERAMQFFAERYWSHPLRDFFFLEENWHCLAARAALGVHRHAGYEKFCLDYVRFKSRLILDARDGVDSDFDGGFGFGNLIPPHNTGAAGFGEAMAAALPILRAEGASTEAEQALLGRVMGFLLRQQWSRDNCFACATPLVVGGMSEHTHSAVTRIDFAQHAWAAIGHGRRALRAP